MSPRDLPLWARAAAAVLLVFAGWWLASTAAIRGVVGPSVAPLSLGVVAGFILRGMHLPLDLWPAGPWRRRFATPAVLGVAAALAVVLVVAAPPPDTMARRVVDPGAFALVPVGAVAWGFGVALVRQRRYLPWYGVAGLAALAPLAVGLLAHGGGSGVAWDVAARTLVFTAGIAVAGALVTEEIALRRLLIGQPSGAGVVVVLLAAAVGAVWHVVVGASLGEGGLSPLWRAVAAGAFVAAPLYVLSRSLLVSALATGLGTGALVTLATLGALGDLTPVFLAQGTVALVLTALVARRNGIWRGLGIGGDDAAGD